MSTENTANKQLKERMFALCGGNLQVYPFVFFFFEENSGEKSDTVQTVKAVLKNTRLQKDLYVDNAEHNLIFGDELTKEIFSGIEDILLKVYAKLKTGTKEISRYLASLANFKNVGEKRLALIEEEALHSALELAPEAKSNQLVFRRLFTAMLMKHELVCEHDIENNLPLLYALVEKVEAAMDGHVFADDYVKGVDLLK